MLASTRVVHRRGLKSCEITPNVFVVWPPPCTEGNKAHGVSAGSLIVKTAGSIQERLAGRHVGDPEAINGVTRPGAPCEGFLARGSNKD